MGGKVTDEVCQRMHELKIEGLSDQAAADRVLEELGVDVTHGAVNYHARGACSHDRGHYEENGDGGGITIEEDADATIEGQSSEPVRFTDYAETKAEAGVEVEKVGTSEPPEGEERGSKTDQEAEESEAATWRLSEDPPEMEAVPEPTEPPEAEAVGDEDAMVAANEPGTGNEPISFFEIIRNERRRAVIATLAQTRKPLKVGDLASRVAAHENDKPVGQVTSKERKRVYVALYQVHMDKMERAGLGEFNKARGLFYPEPSTARRVNEWIEDVPVVVDDMEETGPSLLTRFWRWLARW